MPSRKIRNMRSQKNQNVFVKYEVVNDYVTSLPLDSGCSLSSFFFIFSRH